VRRVSSRSLPLVGLSLGIVLYLCSLVRALGQPIDFDATGYVWLSKVISGADPSQFDGQHLNILFNIRQMGYPAIISPFTNLASSDISLRISISLMQLFIYWFAVYTTQKAVVLIIDQRRARIVSFMLLSLPFPYFLITEVLADSLASTFSLIGFSAVLISMFESSRKSQFLWYASSLMAMAMAMAIRQDTHYAAVIVFLCGALVLGRWLRESFRASLTVLVPFVALLFSGIITVLVVFLFRFPNWYFTSKYLGHGSFQPPGFISTDTFIRGGLQVTRFITGLGDLGGSITWPNPVINPTHLANVSSAWRYYLLHPGEGALSILSKGFALTDWELPFTYYEKIPRNRNWLLSLYNYQLVGNGLLGFCLGSKNLLNRAMGRSQKFVLFAVVFSFVPYLGIHTLSHVEVRFGLPLTIAVAISAALWLSSVRWSKMQILVQLGLIVVWIPISLFVSAWLRGFPYSFL
jgi:hypothetical protein